MLKSRIFDGMKRNYALILTGLCLLLLCGAFIKESVNGQSFDDAKREIALRQIGHMVLLNSGDSTSRVLPVVKLADDEFQIRFERTFTFQTDSLIKIIDRSLAASGSTTNYIVNVLGCDEPAVLFGYAILNAEKTNNTKVKDIVACKGRRQPEKCYRINIKFQNTDLSVAQRGYVLGSLPLLAFVGLLVYRSKNSSKVKAPKVAPQHVTHIIEFGSFVFNIDAKTLFLGDTDIPITTKEAKVLSILAAAPNQIIDRSRLQKEIWEDEGVIVGRSLDMFVSKLRKKLKDDPNVNLANIHGKGYRLEVKS